MELANLIDGVYCVLFTSKTCTTCGSAKKRLAGLKKKFAGVHFLEVDVQSAQGGDEKKLVRAGHVHQVPSWRLMEVVDGRIARVTGIDDVWRSAVGDSSAEFRAALGRVQGAKGAEKSEEED